MSPGGRARRLLLRVRVEYGVPFAQQLLELGMRVPVKSKWLRVHHGSVAAIGADALQTKDCSDIVGIWLIFEARRQLDRFEACLSVAGLLPKPLHLRNAHKLAARFVWDAQKATDDLDNRAERDS